MKKITTIPAALAIGAAAIAIGIASPAAADPTNCETVGGATVCGQGTVGGEAGASNGPVSAPMAPTCRNAYGAYQNCNATR